MPKRGKNCLDSFFLLTIAWLRVGHRELQLVSLESSGNEDSEYVFKIFLVNICFITQTFYELIGCFALPFRSQKGDTDNVLYLTLKSSWFDGGGGG
jgi:hypothetical protein